MAGVGVAAERRGRTLESCVARLWQSILARFDRVNNRSSYSKKHIQAPIIRRVLEKFTRRASTRVRFGNVSPARGVSSDENRKDDDSPLNPPNFLAMAPPEDANGVTYTNLLSSFRAKTAGDGAQKHKKTAEEYGKLWQPEGVENGEDVSKRKENSRDMVNYYCEQWF